jgi:hypothetical protein
MPQPNESLGSIREKTPPGATTFAPKSTPSETTQPKVTPSSAFCAKAGMAASITMNAMTKIRLNISRIPFDERSNPGVCRVSV